MIEYNGKNLTEFMSAAVSENDWSERCDAVKKFYGGDYPPNWYREVVASGLIHEVGKTWPPRRP